MYDILKYLIHTLPLVVRIKPNSFPAQIVAISSSVPVLIGLGTPSSSKAATPSTSTHFLASFSGNSFTNIAGFVFGFKVRTIKPSYHKYQLINTKTDFKNGSY